MDSSLPLTDSLSSTNAKAGEAAFHANEIITLRTQIQANAALLFSAAQAPHASHYISEVGVMATSAGDDKHTRNGQQQLYTAILTVCTGMDRGWTVAAQGEERQSVEAALQSLFQVTAVALGKYRGNTLKGLKSPTELAGGLIEEGLLKQSKPGSWTSIF